MGLDFEQTTSNLEYLIERNREMGNPIHIRMSIVDCGETGEVEKFRQRYANLAEIRTIQLGGWLGKEFNPLPERIQNLHHYCDDLYHQICILSNGDYAICCFDCEGQTALNIREMPILEAFYSKPYEELRALHKNGIAGTMCEDCSFSYERQETENGRKNHQ